MFKQKDLLTLGFVVIFSAVLSIFLSGLIFNNNKTNTNTENVPIISSNFPTNNSGLFKNLNNDPTVLIDISSNNNSNLFNSN